MNYWYMKQHRCESQNNYAEWKMPDQKMSIYYMVPFMWNSRKDITRMIAGQWFPRCGWRGLIGAWGNFWVDENVLYPGSGGSNVAMYLLKLYA